MNTGEIVAFSLLGLVVFPILVGLVIVWYSVCISLVLWAWEEFWGHEE